MLYLPEFRITTLTGILEKNRFLLFAVHKALTDAHVYQSILSLKAMAKMQQLYPVL